MNKSTQVTNSLEETQEIAFKLAKKLKGRSQTSTLAVVIALKGELGGGKTSFAQGFAKALGVKEKVNSPTFNIFKVYKNLYHFDCYRIEDPKEILDLGFEKIVSNPKNIILIEWAEKIKGILPKETTWINFKFIDENKRKITYGSR